MAHKRSDLLIVGGGAWLMLAAPALAHHSYAMFDMQKEVNVKGAVREFHWTNPHSWLVMAVVDANGKVSDVSLETNGPGYLVRQGWKRETLKPGDQITATINPLHDGSSGGNLLSVTFADGRRIFTRAPKGATALSPTLPAGGPGEKQ